VIAMRGREDPLGTLLARAGVISAAEVADLVGLQRQAWPIASLAYALGLADEQTLVAALSLQLGVPGVVLDRSSIVVDVMEGIAPELALEHRILPLAEERHRLLVACEHPHAVREVLRELEFIKGKSVVPHIALKLTLERTLRACLRARERGERLVIGPLAQPGARGAESIVVVGDPARAPGRPSAPATSSATSLARAALLEDVTREVPFEEVVRAVTEDAGLTPGWLDPSGTDPNLDLVLGQLGSRVPSAIIVDGESGSLPLVSPDTAVAQMLGRAGSAPIELIDLDDRDGVEYRPVRGSPGRVLVVDDDFASRQFLVKELVPLGIDVQTAEDGAEALSLLTEQPPDVLVADVMLPGISGLHICRAVKHSRKYSRIGVVLFSAVIESGRVTDELVRRHGADAYFEKPLQMNRFKARLGELLHARGAGADDGPDGQASFEHALSLYRAGELDGAMSELRRGIEQDPMSAKHHFVLANLLHKKELIVDAIDEYEATLELKPDYFPALTRLAYLYYQQGYAARAIDTWRRSLPLCSDPGLRRNIEVFMRKLIGDLDRR
jgi:DNA-binding response OmpR family regulator